MRCAGCVFWDRSVSPVVCGHAGRPEFNSRTDAKEGCDQGLPIDAAHSDGTVLQQASSIRVTLRSLLRMAEIPGLKAQSVLDANDLREMSEAMDGVCAALVSRGVA